LTGDEAEAVRITSSGNVGIGTTLPAEKLTVAGNISASGTIFGAGSYFLSFTPFVSASVVGVGAGGVITNAGTASIYPGALSGVMPANEISARLSRGVGTIEGSFIFDKSDNTTTAQFVVEVAKNANFTTGLQAIYLKSGGETSRIIMRPILGTVYSSIGRIIFPTPNSTSPIGGTGASSPTTISYPFSFGDTLYWRVGFVNAGTVGTTLGMAVSSGFLRVIP
jgi:hypothetical protein